jgi:hypothetical protein
VTPAKLSRYAQQAQALANAIYAVERGEGAEHLEAVAVACAALVETATRVTLDCCAMSKAEFLFAVGEHFDLVAADLDKRRAEDAN